MEVDISVFIREIGGQLASAGEAAPWDLTARLPTLILSKQAALGGDYSVDQGIAIHSTAVIEQGVVLKAPVIISANCFVGAHAYLRQGVFLGEGARIGPGCEVKSSYIGSGSALAHFNFVGDCLVGSHVNFEAGAIVANHYNEREDKRISVVYDGKMIDTGATKFGGIVGDHCRIGANAVLSPGTLLTPGSIVKRLELVEQTATAK